MIFSLVHVLAFLKCRNFFSNIVHFMTNYRKSTMALCMVSMELTSYTRWQVYSV